MISSLRPFRCFMPLDNMSQLSPLVPERAIEIGGRIIWAVRAMATKTNPKIGSSSSPEVSLTASLVKAAHAP
jgi:hypothetical protein